MFIQRIPTRLAKFVLLAMFGATLAACEQRGAETSGASESTERSAADGGMNPPGTLGPQGSSEKTGSSGGTGTGY